MPEEPITISIVVTKEEVFRLTVIERVRGRLVVAALGFVGLFSVVAVRLFVVSMGVDVGEIVLGGAGILTSGAVQVAFVWANIFAGYALYRMRCRRLGAYGLLEIGVGLFTAVLMANQMFGTPIPGIFSIVIPQIAALYVMVRGLDNIQKALPDGRLKEWWDRHFFGRGR